MDKPDGLGGSDMSPSMVEVILGTYGSCLIVGYTLNASLAGTVIDEIKSEIEGQVDQVAFLDIYLLVPA